MAFNPLECKICCNTYNDDHCPRILPCSHEFCSRCINELISTPKKTCAICRLTFTANSAEDLMVNRGLLDAAKQLPSKHVGPKSLSKEQQILSTGPKILSTRPKKSILEFTKDFRENVIEKGIAVCQETEAEVRDLTESYRKMRGAFEGLVQTLEKTKVASDKTLSFINQNEKLLMKKMEAMQAHFSNMKDSEAKLKAAADFASAGPVLDEAEEVLQDTESNSKEIKSLLQESKRQNTGNIKDTLKMKVSLGNALEVIERMIEEEEQQEPEQEQEEGEPEEERGSVMKITVTDLRSPQGRLRGDAQRRVFTMMTYEGTLRVAPVKIESNNQFSFIHLQEGVLPPRCFVIELESLMQWSPSLSPSPSPSSPPRAFLDLVYESTPLGRVIVRVTENGLKGLNFLHMSAGGMGPSFAHSHVSSVGCKGEEGEHVNMGCYIPHGGGGEGGGGGDTSTRAVLSSREDWEREREERKRGVYEETPWKAGEVRGIISCEGASRFWIVTRDDPFCVSGYCFGMVEEGLDVLHTTILKYPDIWRVRVGECGLIL